VPSFVIPADFTTGAHSADFVGVTSGKVTVPFSVVSVASGPATTISTGGSLTSARALMGSAAGMLLAVLGVYLGLGVVKSRRLA